MTHAFGKSLSRLWFHWTTKDKSSRTRNCSAPEFYHVHGKEPFRDAAHTKYHLPPTPEDSSSSLALVQIIKDKEISTHLTLDHPGVSGQEETLGGLSAIQDDAVATSDVVDVDYTRLGRDVRCQQTNGIKVGNVDNVGVGDSSSLWSALLALFTGVHGAGLWLFLVFVSLC